MKKLRVVGVVLLLASVVVFWVAVEARGKAAGYRVEADAIRRQGGDRDGGRYDTARSMQKFHGTNALMYFAGGVVSAGVGVWLLVVARRRERNGEGGS